MGSTRNAAVRGLIADESASASPNGTVTKPGVNGPKPFSVFRVGGCAHERRRPSVEIPRADDHLGAIARDALAFVGPPARGFDGGLDGFGAGIHRQHNVPPSQLRELVTEERELVVVKRSRGQGDAAGLCLQRCQNGWVCVPLIHRRIRTQAIEIATALGVVHPDALGSSHDYRERGVIVGAPTCLEFEQLS